MKTSTVLGIVLLVLGAIALAYQGFTYTTQKKVLDVGPIHATTDQTHSVPIPPIIGGLLIVGGVVALLSGAGGKTV